MPYTREDIAFDSGEGARRARCAAWLYRPQKSAAPVIIMAHGLGSTRVMRLDAYAQRFAEAGYAVLLFDYRYFGDSEGRPRQLIDIACQREDWRSAISFARSISGVDGNRIALFGSSFSGGHVIRIAARCEVSAVISQCPFTDGFASSRTLGVRGLVGVGLRAIADQAGAVLGRRPVMVPLAAEPGRTGLMNSADAASGFRALLPTGAEAPPQAVAARIGLRIPLDRPGRAAKDVRAPILFCICDTDTVAPPGPTSRYAAQAPNATIKHYPFGHFDIYLGEHFERAIADQLTFLREHLPVADG